MYVAQKRSSLALCTAQYSSFSSSKKRCDSVIVVVANVRGVREAVRSVDPAATNNDVAVVEDHGLTGRDRQLRLVEDQFRTRLRILERRHHAGRGTVTMADLCGDTERTIRPTKDPVHARSRERAALECSL